MRGSFFLFFFFLFSFFSSFFFFFFFFQTGSGSLGRRGRLGGSGVRNEGEGRPKAGRLLATLQSGQGCAVERKEQETS